MTDDIGRIHVPVMAARIVELLRPALDAPASVFVDCTLGMAGHSVAVLDAAPSARLVGIDRDADALALARERLASFSDRVTLVQAVYDELPDVLDDLGLPRVHAILADLGLSSLQIDRRERGFAYAVDAPLDMRMDASAGPTAADVLNTYSAAELTRILRTYGEERFSDRIARALVRERAATPFTTSARMVQVISDAIPAAARHTGGHPAKRTFQALRIEVNRELEALEGLLREESCPVPLRVTEDVHPRRGPLEGLASGLECLRTPWAFALGCDMPFVREATVRCLWERRTSRSQVVCGERGGCLEPLHAFYAVSCL